jgi:hypothetical protein
MRMCSPLLRIPPLVRALLVGALVSCAQTATSNQAASASGRPDIVAAVMSAAAKDCGCGSCAAKGCGPCHGKNCYFCAAKSLAVMDCGCADCTDKGCATCGPGCDVCKFHLAPAKGEGAPAAH